MSLREQRRPPARCGGVLLALLALAAADCRCGPPYEADQPRRVVDFHTHIAPGAAELAAGIFERAGVTTAVNLSMRPHGVVLATVAEEAAAVVERHPGVELLFFAGIDWGLVDHPDFGALAAEGVRRAAALGARGVKIPKALGLGVRTVDGRLLRVDDPRLDPVWRTAGDLGLPVAIHTGDPLAFFQPPTPDNERYEELRAHPGWSFHGGDYPSLEELLVQRDAMVARHPETVFVAVHVGGYAEDLEAVSRSMRRLPNLWIDLAARLPELGRHEPRRVRAFFEEFQDRILFGTDLQVSQERVVLGAAGDDERPGPDDAQRYYDVHWRFLETRDRRMPHVTPIQGRWTVDAVGLRREVLDKVYHDNARRLLARAGATARGEWE